MTKTRNLNSIFLWILTLADMAVVVAAFLSAYWVRFVSGWMGSFVPDSARWEYYWRASPLIALVFWVTFKYMGLYRQRRGISSVDELSRLFRGTLFSLLLLSGAAFFVREFFYSIKVFLLTAGLSLLALALWRFLFRIFQVSLRRRGVGVLRSVVVGSGGTGLKVLEKIRSNPGLGYRAVGMVDDLPKGTRLKGQPVPWLGPIKNLEKAVRAAQADVVIVALPASMHARTHEILLGFHIPGVELRIVSDLYGFITTPLAVDEIHGIPVFAMKEAPLDRFGNRVIKRAFDLGLTVPGLLLLSPLLLVLALAVRLTSKGPIFFAQERVGLNDRVFKMLKFRSMKVDAEKETGPVWASKDDSRRTAIGAFLRGSSLDELPQLLNVLKGDMSLVGPRPERPHFVKKFMDEGPRYLHRHQVKAGITGWAQVNGLRGNTSVQERTSYDLYYVENWSFSMDLMILVRTVLELFEHKTAY